MFKRIVIDFTILAVSFFGMWFLLSQVHFVSVEKKLEISQGQEERLGSMMKTLYLKNATVIENKKVNESIGKITGILESKLSERKYNYRVIVIKTSDINAFSLPGGYILIYSGLIEFCEAPEELAGVIAHEMGHNENHDVLNRMAKHIGISITLNAVFGGDNGRLSNMLQQVISTKFDRQQEAMADAFAVDLMKRCGINPEFYARFFERLMKQEPEVIQHLDFLMTHPADSKRIEAIKQRSGQFKMNEQPLGIDWEELKNNCR